MPLMLEHETMDTMDASMPLPVDAMQVDLGNVDIFGDPLPPLPRHAPSKQLLQRVDELRSRGCCQSIAWSRQGTIASIVKDGRSIELRFLRCSPENGSWDLSEPTPCTIFANSFTGGPVVHLAWAATGSPELAVIDSVGRVSILSFSITLNRPYQVRRWDADLVDDLHAVVGCYWLPLMPQSRQYNVLHGPAARDGDKYRYESSFVHAYSPWHPNTAKSALLLVTTDGVLKLFFPQNNNRIEETSLELESVTSSDDLVTHAALCSEKPRVPGSQGGGSLLIALATSSKQLRVIDATLDWGLPRPDKQVPAGSLHLSPSLKEKHIAVTSWLQHGPNESTFDLSMAQLSHLEVFPSTLIGSGPGPSWAPPLVLAVRSYLPQANSTYSQDQYQSIIDRWEVLTEQPQTLHKAFEQLGSRIGLGSAPHATARLKKLESIVINRVIIAIHTVQFGRVIYIAFSDGTVQYRDRVTMDEIYNTTNRDRIMTLSQAGFQITEETPCLQVAFSPTNCSFVQICEDGKVRWVGMRYSLGDIGSSFQDASFDPASYSAVIAGLTVAISSAASQQMSYDDVLAIARPFVEKNRFAFDWVMEIVAMLRVPVDYSEESHHDQLVRNSHLQLCLSVLNHMGFRGDFQSRSFGGKFALLALNVRNIVILITIASNQPTGLKEKLTPLDEHEVVDALAGCAKWALDLLSWLTDCLFNLLDDPKFTALLNAQRFPEITAYLEAKNDVSLHLLLCSSTRGFLSAACRRVIHLEGISNRAILYYETKTAIQNATDPTGTAPRNPSLLYQAYQKMHHFTSGSLIKVHEFDRLLSSLGADIRAAYQASLNSLAKNPQSNSQQNPGGGGASGGRQGQQLGAGGANTNAIDPAIKRAQAQCELGMLLASPPPPAFLQLVRKFFYTDLSAFRAETDPARLFFANFDLLEVEDDRRSLAAKRAAGRYVDVFKRVELRSPLKLPSGEARDSEETQRDGGGSGPSSAMNTSSGGGGGGGAVAGAGAGANAASPSPGPQWRRCVRCASVMEDVYGHRPGFTFVLAQQLLCFSSMAGEDMDIESAEQRLKAMEHSEQHYFNSYNHHGIHEEMLKDEVRTRSYMNAIVQNKHLFKDKIVLDVGCGTAILSMFAVKAGARHVIGVDMSTIIFKAREIVQVNGMADKITLIQGKMEEIEMPFPKVDIIISEWMGYFLLYESMLDTVLYARDKYLVEDGLIFPDKATIFVAGIEDGDYKDEKIGFWDNVYGFDYTPLKETALSEPLVDTVEIKAVVTDPAPVLTLDLYKCKPEDLSFSVPFDLACRRDDFIHALVAWFDIEFAACHKPIRFSTGPHTKYTHWKQTVFYLKEMLTVQQGEQVHCSLTNRPNVKNRRDLDIKIEYRLDTQDPTRFAEGVCTYRMC